MNKDVLHDIRPQGGTTPTPVRLTHTDGRVREGWRWYLYPVDEPPVIRIPTTPGSVAPYVDMYEQSWLSQGWTVEDLTA